ncbi:MAG: hypothetical protein JWO17_1435 [Actinomycetia bacterium]|nr:hypothetical protein [Actinomycetes bacterium]
MRAAIAIAPFALLATSCGGKAGDPYAKSLAMGSEHVEMRGWVTANGKTRIPISASGDFTNTPDRGTLTVHMHGATFREVFDRNTVYVQRGNDWVRARVEAGSPQTPAQFFRARRPARAQDGLVRHIDDKSRSGFLSVDFSRYGAHVSVTVPRVKGSK